MVLEIIKNKLLNGLFIILFLFCQKGVAQSNNKIPGFVRNIDFVGLDFSMEGSDPPLASPRFLNKNERDFLNINELFGKPELLKDRFWIRARFNFSPNYHSLLIAFYKSDKSVERHLVNYSKSWKVLTSLKLTSYTNEKDFESFFMEKEMLSLVRKNGAYSHFKRFLFSSKGEVIPFVYGTFDSWNFRVVKAKSGLIYRDIEGKRIGKLNFGDAVYIESYSRDSIEIEDGSQRIKTRKAKIILDKDAYAKHLVLDEIKYPFAFLPEYWLFGNRFSDSKYGEEYYYEHPEDEGILDYYENDYISTGGNNSEAQIDLLELFDIRKVNLMDYKDKIVLEQKFDGDALYSEQGKNFSIDFGDGSKREFRDTIYREMEYSPSSHFEKIDFPEKPEAVLIFHSFFEDCDFFLLNKMNGDTLARFDGYPFYSPNSKWIFCANTPYSYENETSSIQLNYNSGENYISLIRVNFTQWNLPELLEFYWLSDEEFIIKVIEPGEASENKKDRKSFFLKYKILLD